MTSWVTRKEAVKMLGIDNSDFPAYAQRNGIVAVNSMYRRDLVQALADKLAALRNAKDIIETLTPDMMTSVEVVEFWGVTSQNLRKRYMEAGIIPLGVYGPRKMLVFSRSEVFAALPGLNERRARHSPITRKKREQKKKIVKPSYPLATAFLKKLKEYEVKRCSV